MNQTTDSIITLLADVMEPYLRNALGGLEVKVLQAYRGNLVDGESPDPVVYIYEVTTVNHGFRHERNTPNLSNGVDVEELQYRQTLFQLWGYVPPAADGLTTADVVNMAAMAMQSNRLLAALKAQGIGVLRVTEVTNPFRSNEYERFEANPTFDVTITHRVSVTDVAPAIEAGPLEIYPV